jgi:DinB superfamily
MEAQPSYGPGEMQGIHDYRARLIARFEQLPTVFARTIAGIPEADWWLRRGPDGRNIHATMVHVRDLEVQAFLPRLRRILAETEPTLTAFPSHRWTDDEYDSTEPMEGLLADYARACDDSLALIRDLPQAGWARRGFHPPTGWRTAQWWVERALAHGLEHLTEIRAARIA